MAMIIKAKDPDTGSNRGVTSTNIEGIGGDPDRQGLDVNILNGKGDDDILRVMVDGFELHAEQINLNTDELEDLLREIKAGKNFKYQFILEDDDFDENDKVTIPVAARPVSWAEIVNLNDTDPVTMTINGRSVTVMQCDVNSKGISYPFSFCDSFPEFTEITVTGTDRHVIINVDGPEAPEE